MEEMAVKTNLVLVSFWSHFGDVLGSFWCHFRPWGVPGVPVGSFEWLDGVLGGPLGSPEGRRAVPWASLGVLWGSLGHPWGPMGHPWGVLMRTVGVP